MKKSAKEVLEEFRQEQIVQAALSVIEERTFEDTTIEEIAQRAGVSRSTIYLHFKNKQEVLGACLSFNRERLLDELQQRISAVEGFAPQLQAFLEVLLELTDEHRDLFRAVTNSNLFTADPPGRWGAELARLIKDFQESLDAVLAEAGSRGELRANVQATAREQLGMLILGAMTARTLASASLSVPEMAQRVVEMAQFGLLASRKGSA